MTAPNLDNSLWEGVDLEKKAGVKLVPGNQVGRLSRKEKRKFDFAWDEVDQVGVVSCWERR